MLNNLGERLSPNRSEVIESVRKVIDNRGHAMLNHFLQSLERGDYDDVDPMEFLGTWLLLLLDNQVPVEHRETSLQIRGRVRRNFRTADQQTYVAYYRYYREYPTHKSEQ